MDIDFTAVLLLAGTLTGAIIVSAKLWGYDTRAHSAPNVLVEHSIVYARAFFPVIVAVVLIRAFIFEPFRIPSASMMPGLVDGDFILVDKFSYGLRLPILNTKIVAIGKPRRGDVVVFRLPADPSVHYIKRLIGMPGDRIVVRENRVTINGSPIPVIPDGFYSGGYGFNGSELGVESLGDKHLLMFASSGFSTDFDAIVPTGQYFFMGDNRNDSQDSRFPQVGFVPERNLVGRAELIWMNWRVPGWPNVVRIGMRIR